MTIVSNKITGTVVLNILKNVFTPNTNRSIVLGRWGSHNLSQNNLKVDYSNEDHCGTCSQYIQNQGIKIPVNEYDYITLNVNTQSMKNKNY
jgi:hypothetical protein